MRVMTAAARSATAVSVLLIGLTNAQAQTAFISVNGGRQLASNDFTHDVTFSFAVLPNTFANVTEKVEYPVGNTAAFDVAGGVYATRNIGVGAAFTLVKQNQQASLTSEIPDFGVGPIHRMGMTAFDRSEKGIHVQLMGMVPVHERLTLCFFGGPSFAAVTQDVIAQVGFGSFVVPRQELDDTAWGFNVGGDVAWFFTNNIGIGGAVRFTRATVEFPNLLRETASPSGNAGNPPFLEGQRRVESDAGGTQLMVGMRFRFP
jgi:hypothetical protein